MKLSTYNLLKVLVLGFVLLFTTSCKKFVDIGTPNGTVPATEVFKTDASATAAVSALYSNGNWRDAQLYATLTCGAAADELVYNFTDNLVEYQNNAIAPTNGYVANYLWFFSYQQITNANIAIAGLSASQTLTPAVKNQLLGEAKFWRAMAYFQLNNIFGGVPLALSSEPLESSLLPRSSTAQVNAQILSDLKDAKALLKPEYPTTERARVNVYAVSAFLARVYLYQKDWANAEAEATSVISSGVYTLSPLASTFVKTSTETILQVWNLNGFNSWGATFVPASATSGNPNWYLRADMVNAFETGDARKAAWTAQIGVTANYSVSKYKLRTGTAGNEYYVSLRLAEQHLIRAEARAQQDKLTGANSAETDLNVIRTKASLLGVSNLTKPAMLLAIEKERRVELFGEYPHRWFDLKRTPSTSNPSLSRADDVLSVIKGTNWQPTDVLFPIPDNQFQLNPNLTPNPGY